jgi:hypothetical protein
MVNHVVVDTFDAQKV